MFPCFVRLVSSPVWGRCPVPSKVAVVHTLTVLSPSGGSARSELGPAPVSGTPSHRWSLAGRPARGRPSPAPAVPTCLCARRAGSRSELPDPGSKRPWQTRLGVSVRPSLSLAPWTWCGVTKEGRPPRLGLGSDPALVDLGNAHNLPLRPRLLTCKMVQTSGRGRDEDVCSGGALCDPGAQHGDSPGPVHPLPPVRRAAVISATCTSSSWGASRY